MHALPERIPCEYDPYQQNRLSDPPSGPRHWPQCPALKSSTTIYVGSISSPYKRAWTYSVYQTPSSELLPKCKLQYLCFISKLGPERFGNADSYRTER